MLEVHLTFTFLVTCSILLEVGIYHTRATQASRIFGAGVLILLCGALVMNLYTIVRITGIPCT